LRARASTGEAGSRGPADVASTRALARRKVRCDATAACFREEEKALLTESQKIHIELGYGPFVWISVTNGCIGSLDLRGSEAFLECVDYARDTWRGQIALPTTPSINPRRAVRSSPTRKRITMVGAAVVGLTAPAVRPVARATQGANARAARSVRVGAVVPGLSSRSAPGLRHRPVRGRRVIVGERKSDSEGPLDTVEIEECLQVRPPPTSARGSSGFYLLRREPSGDGAGDVTSRTARSGGVAERRERRNDVGAARVGGRFHRRIATTCAALPPSGRARVPRSSAISR